MQVSLYPTQQEISRVMKGIRNARIGVFGDFCIDAYWELDSSVPEISLETGKQVQHVRRERYSPGGAGNVVVNLCALGVTSIKVFAIIGDDVFGREMTRELSTLGVDTGGLVIQKHGWATPVYGKPLLDSVEQQRMDFGLFNEASELSLFSLKRCLCESRTDIDFLIVNQQIPHGWCSDRWAQWMSSELQTNWVGRHIVDARHYVPHFKTNALKVNVAEAMSIAKVAPVTSGTTKVPFFGETNALALLSSLTRESEEALFITRSENGMLAGNAESIADIPGVNITGPTDPVGAGDTATAMLAACRAINLDPRSSAIMANLAASITVGKINQTGTADEQEMVSAAGKLSYIFNPVLAEDSRTARIHMNSTLEIVDSDEAISNPSSDYPFSFAMFDHDGTISTLRQGWEQVMEPVMVHSILGSRYNHVSHLTIDQVSRQVQRFIEQSTGIQTIAQMDELVKMVEAFDIAPVDERRDAWGYKKAYNDALMAMIEDRISKIMARELDPYDFIMKGAVEFLTELTHHEVTLFLVSGTDEADVIREAQVLGYAHLFGSNIHGAKPGSRSDTKSNVIQTLLESIGKGATDSRLLVVGDGPVEIQLGRRFGALSLGIASHEERRFGMNATKRRRLIRAGAHCVVPDFAQWSSLFHTLRDIKPHVQACQLQ